MKDRIYNSLMGFVIGDAVGVPIEFMDKDEIAKLQLDDYVETYRSNQPIGSWSDDSSLTLCLVETINENGLNFNLYSKKMIKWLFENYMTPNNKAFGIGRGTFFSIGKLQDGVSYKESGEKSINSNGNGSLMRIIPLVFYINPNDESRFEIVETCSAITHAHDISKISCCIYTEYFWQLMKTQDKIKAYNKMQEIIKKQYSQNQYITSFDSILNNNIYDVDYNQLSGSGYVITTLENVLYCFINGNSYKDCVIKALKIGGDTDTNAAITGGLAGYFYNEINEKWLEKLIKKDMVEKLITTFVNKCEKR